MQKLHNIIAAWIMLISLFSISAYTVEAAYEQKDPPKKSQDNIRLSKEDSVREAVFNYQIELTTSHLQQKDVVFFLSVDQGNDPSDVLIAGFAGRRPPVKKVSESVSKKYESIFDKETGEKGIVFSVASVAWINETEAEVEGGNYSAPLSASGHVYKVQFENGKWVVKDDNMKWISRLVAA